MVYWLISLVAVLILLLLLMLVRRYKLRKRTPPTTYGGPIRFTAPDGKNMKIIRKDDGTFEVMEE